jgi:MFS transporter, FLVCR family, MFS-domain-containing protein 7
MARTNSNHNAVPKSDNDAPPGWVSMKGLGSKMRNRDAKDKSAVLSLETVGSNASADNGLREIGSADGLLDGEDGRHSGNHTEVGAGTGVGNGQANTVYKVYKRRWFGLLQLALLNIIVSWDVSTLLLPSLSAAFA